MPSKKQRAKLRKQQKSTIEKIIHHRTHDERSAKVNEIKMKMLENKLNTSLTDSCKKLWEILDDYVEKGTVYDEELPLMLGDLPRKIIVQLHNDKMKQDLVVIRADKNKQFDYTGLNVDN